MYVICWGLMEEETPFYTIKVAISEMICNARVRECIHQVKVKPDQRPSSSSCHQVYE